MADMCSASPSNSYPTLSYPILEAPGFPNTSKVETVMKIQLLL